MKIDSPRRQNLFTTRGFIIAAVVVVIIAITGVLIIVTNSDDPPMIPQAEISITTESTEPLVADNSESICGLREGSHTGYVSAAPAAEWHYQGILAYPSSPELGPGMISTHGFRYCFQHSTAGAVVAAANHVAHGGESDPAFITAWLEYFVADGPFRDTILAGIDESGTTYGGIRIRIAGYRLMSYDQQSARVDIALKSVVDGRDIMLSMIYDLIWREGDWRLSSSNSATPINSALITDLNSYVIWGA